MRKLIAMALIAPALFIGTVAAEDEAPQPCGTDLKHPILAAGDTLSSSDLGAQTVQFYVDPTVTERGRIGVSAALVWENAVNDWDLDVNGTLSENYQPFDAPFESASYSARGDCKLISVTVFDFLAPLPELGMTLDISVG